MHHMGQPPLFGLHGGLQDALKALFAQRAQAGGRRRHVLQRRLLLGVELLAKIDEEVVLPALAEGGAVWAPRVASAMREVELLRDAATLAVQTISANRELALSMLDGLTMLHGQRVQSLLDDAGSLAVDWTQLEHKVRALLGRWRSDIESETETEDHGFDATPCAMR